MRFNTFPPPPPLPPLPPILDSAREVNHHSSVLNNERIDLIACRNSDKEIWKAGLDNNKGELEVVFGELKTDQLFGATLSSFPDPGRSIIIPSRNQHGDKGDCRVTELKSGGPGPFSGALNSHRSQLPGIKNSRFKEYLKKYFPKENVVMQPLENMIRYMAKEGRIACASQEQKQDLAGALTEPSKGSRACSPAHVSIQDRLIRVNDVYSPLASPRRRAVKTVRRPNKAKRGAEIQNGEAQGGNAQRGPRSLSQRQTCDEEHKRPIQKNIQGTQYVISPKSHRIIHVSTSKYQGSRENTQISAYHRRVMNFYYTRKQYRRQVRRGQAGVRATSNDTALFLSYADRLPPQPTRSQSYQPHSRQSVMNSGISPIQGERTASVAPRSAKTQTQIGTNVESVPKQGRHDQESVGQSAPSNPNEASDQSSQSDKAAEAAQTRSSSLAKPPKTPVPGSSISENKEEGNTLVTSQVDEIGDVCRKLKMCVASEHNTVLNSFLLRLVALGDSGKHNQRFKSLKTLMLEPSFVEKLGSLSAQNHHRNTCGERGEGKYLALPPWEQRFLGLWQSHCANRIVLVHQRSSGSNLKCLAVYADKEN
uniref:Reverse transcriptase domain-containing protein n=1 Tax=Mesocestoides corti TaxID=53468 RepID=A0A5K3FIS7_MESCO